MRSIIGATLRHRAASASAAPAAPSRTEFREYQIRISYSNVSKTRFDNWVTASGIDDALALTRKKYPTASAIEYLGESRPIPIADVERERGTRRT